MKLLLEKARLVVETCWGSSALVAIVSALALADILQMILFLFNVSCSGWPFGVSVSLVAIILLCENSKLALKYLLIIGVLLILTAFTTSYCSHDAIGYHFPAQDILIRGWNPIYEATRESFEKYVGATQFAVDYVLFLPRINALTGALVASAVGFFVADSFLNYAFLFLLFAVSVRFSEKFWGASRLSAVVFSCGIVWTSKVTSIFAGLTDYLLYSTTLISIFSLVLWLRKHERRDLYCMCLSMIFCAFAKSAGMFYIVVLLVLLFAKGRHFSEVRWAVFLWGICFLLLGFSPFVTSTLHYGCPFYPAVSFSSAHPAVEMTHDFGGNADALQMGYFARICYAWVSPSLAIKCCAWWYGKDVFNPMFQVCGGVAGLGTWYRLLLLFSCLSFLASRKNAVFYVCIGILLISNIAPLKWIGFARYFPLMWAVPFLAFFNFVFNPIWLFQNKMIQRVLMPGVLLFTMVFSGLFAARSMAFFGRQLAMERERQKMLSEVLRGKNDFQIENHWGSYGISRYLALRGRCVTFGRPIEGLSYDSDFLIASTRDSMQQVERISVAYPIVNSIRDLVRFDWRHAFWPLPSVLKRGNQMYD